MGNYCALVFGIPMASKHLLGRLRSRSHPELKATSEYQNFRIGADAVTDLELGKGGATPRPRLQFREC